MATGTIISGALRPTITLSRPRSIAAKAGSSSDWRTPGRKLWASSKATYGPLGLDRTQSLAVNYIYDIPSLARPNSFLGNAVGKVVFDGWQLSGLTSISSGAPVNVSYSITNVPGPT